MLDYALAHLFAFVACLFIGLLVLVRLFACFFASL
jgi:hypothetical protein